MDGAAVRVTLSLIGPGIMLVFSLAFAGAWLIDKRRPYLMLLAAACALFALGTCSQILHWPNDIGVNSVISGALYTAAVLLASQALLLRSRRQIAWQIILTAFAAITAALWYFYYVDRSLLARVYIQNFGYGLILLVAALRLTGLSRGRYADRILFWLLLIFALHFFPRTLMTIGFSAPSDIRAFASSTFWQTLQLSLAVLGSALALAVLVAAFSDLLDNLRQERDIDFLTSILNRRGFEDRVATALASLAGPASLVICDLDHFKLINDRHGHDTGDAVLKDFGQILRSMARKRDVVGRLGGEEFALFLPATYLAEAHECAERLRLAVARHTYDPPHVAGSVTASFGVAQTGTSDTWESLYKRADTNLYAAKQAGRNRTVSDDHDEAGTRPLPLLRTIDCHAT